MEIQPGDSITWFRKSDRSRTIQKVPAEFVCHKKSKVVIRVKTPDGLVKDRYVMRESVERVKQ